MRRKKADTRAPSARGAPTLYSAVGHLYSLGFPDGGIAQLGERLHGMQEVSGSIPLTSTIQKMSVTGPHRLEA